jgi:hypothetical protein
MISGPEPEAASWDSLSAYAYLILLPGDRERDASWYLLLGIKKLYLRQLAARCEVQDGDDVSVLVFHGQTLGDLSLLDRSESKGCRIYFWIEHDQGWSDVNVGVMTQVGNLIWVDEVFVSKVASTASESARA